MTALTAHELTCIIPTDRRIIVPASWVGKKVIVTLGRKKRSTDANAWMWGIAYAKYLAPELGYETWEMEELHDDVLMAMYGTKISKAGNQVPIKRTSGMNTKEFSEHMDALVRWAAKTCNCVIPLPDEGR